MNIDIVYFVHRCSISTWEIQVKKRGYTMVYISEKLVIGMDVGSTTVKATVVDPENKKILWSDYQRHHPQEINQRDTPEIEQQSLPEFEQSSEHPQRDDTQV